MTMTKYIYRGVEHEKTGAEGSSSANFAGVYRGSKYTNQQTKQSIQPKQKSGVYRGVRWGLKND